MAYQAEISRNNPSVFLFLIDQSGSMADKFGGGGKKDQAVADAINRLLQNLVIKCAKSEGVRDYYHIGVIGYGAQVGPAFGGSLSGVQLVPISTIAESPVEIDERTKKIDDGAGGLVDSKVRFPIWFKPLSSGGTPMREAFDMARQIIADWLLLHPDAFPPIVINITDGEPNDDPSINAQAIRSLQSSDGNVLLFNAHISSMSNNAIEFPNGEQNLPDQYARQLFSMSSELPEYMRLAAKEEGFNVENGARGFVFNADLVSVIRFLDIGTRPSNLR